MKKRKKKKKLKKTVKLILLLILIILIALIIYPKVIKKTITTEKNSANLTDYHIYGTSLSLSGNLTIKEAYNKIELVLLSTKEKTYKVITNTSKETLTFSLSNNINTGLFLDELPPGKYYLFIRTSKIDEKNSTKDKKIYNYKYYKLTNKTNYKDSTYYTLSKYNHKIIINSNNNYKTLMLNIEPNKDKDIYDIVIDPGHGGIDSGATTKEYNEETINMNISNYLKKELEKNGLKVKLTRTSTSLKSDEYFQEYNSHGRAVIPNEVHAKYLISIHTNSSESSKVNGIELYTASNIDYTLARNIIKTIIKNLNIKPSTKEKHKIESGIYTHNFTESEIKETLLNYDKKGYKRYQVTTKSNYLYMIREPGGIITGAYIDKRNQDTVGYNPYYNTNIAPESYLLELGYITNKKDLKILTTKYKEYAYSISKAIVKTLNQ